MKPPRHTAPQAKAVILLSGGLDSATTLFVARQAGLALYALSFAYGQRQSIEIDAATRLARQAGCIEHRIVPLDLRAWGGSALTSSSLAVPKNRPALRQGQPTEVPITYVPARNTIFLAYALAWAEVLEAFQLYIGANAVDYSGYPDCRPAFLSAFTQLANLATKAGIEGPPHFEVQAPLLHLSKAAIIRLGCTLGIDFSLTHSCYDPQADKACGACDACILRRQGFLDAGIADPTRYAPSSV